MADSFWLAEDAEPLPRVRRAGRVDVAVIGGGVTGCACALALGQAGLRVRLYEAREIASGASGRNGGFALRGGSMPYHRAREQIGRDRAQSLWRTTERYLDRLESLAGNAFRRVGSLRLAADPAERDDLADEFDALGEDGFSVEWRGELEPPLDRLFHAAILHPGDGALQPARWVRRLARLAAEARVELHERSRVHSLEELDAEQIVIATDGYTSGLLPELDAVVRPARGQVIATEPLPERLFTHPHYARRGYDYWQQTQDGRLVIGGRRDSALEDEFTAEEATTAGVQSQLEQLVRQLLGRVPPITHRWAGIFGTTADGFPLVGAMPGHSGLWVACGYTGHGNVLGLACGELLAAAILGRPDPVLDIFDPARALEVVSRGAGSARSVSSDGRAGEARAS
jgi:gamma-glutamylputrescine oxidase